MSTEENTKKLVMYDVRGIQKYIFRTAKVKDAIGASKIIEDIISKALEYAVKTLGKEKNALLKWCNDETVCEYDGDDKDIQVLYIGGGNAFVVFSAEELALEVNKRMAKYVLENTYSLQLAVAMVDKTQNYSEDYKKLYSEMNKVKADMVVSKPLGALPVMEIEIKTGYPLIDEEYSTESKLKKVEGNNARENISNKETILDSYVTEKGVDCNIAIVHIDGNNMGLRIRELIKDVTNYVAAVNKMRDISFRINSSYKDVFDQMKKEFNSKTSIEGKDNSHFIMEVLVAGDDITYVCNAKIALATVEYYCNEISKYVMYGDENKEEDKKNYGFSVCAGVAYIGSHFPFYAGYEVAEACCESAKDRAKKPENKDGDRIGNFVDFQICKNIHTKNLEETRKREYSTADGKELLTRPYYIHIDSEKSEKFSEIKEREYSFEKFKNLVKYFQDEKNIPSSLAKKLRNTYSLGETQMNLIKSFMDSRGWKLPDDKNNFYDESKAIFYDALEMMDYYMEVKIEEEASEVNE